jgi:hypothetical protein
VNGDFDVRHGGQGTPIPQSWQTDTQFGGYFQTHECE